ncbi:Major facilitator superfamily domain general substrate transporter [Penicillium cataractarum]|uniref:Major facilitator superfamily domain general substrate transporter n=1 Tax=Penicillium cataractarum TaxID=2100454 RepID=A0A9W9V621_9EURO|nr:Major facilitator superfamily domain general substrate transporter [Penicillium cataractarum]KAJ5369024.1 Major facilitator superfamily domain general substrate transporter [Penicillium cataractarum]
MKETDDIRVVPDEGNSPGQVPSNKTRSKAVDFLASHAADAVNYTYEEEKAVLRRIDKRVLVIVLWAYFFQQLDKSSLSYVSIFGISDDAHLVGRQYSWLGSILYLAQLVMQPLAALILVKLPTGRVLAAAIFLWGSSLSIMTACTNFPSLLGMRFVLGSFEAFIAPCCIAITQMWWRRSEQTLRVSYWNAMNGITSIIGSLMTYGLGHIHSDKIYRYQTIFLFCGLTTVLFSVLVFWLMPDSPVEAKFLSEREKLIAVERLRANQMGISTRQWRWDHVLETIVDLKTWCWFFAIIAISISSGGIGTFGSLIVKSFGFNSFQTILFNIPFGVIQVISILGAGWVATKTQRKGLVIAGLSVLPTVGTIMMLTVPRNQRGVLLFGYYLVSSLAGITPMLYAWQAQNTAGETKKKCTSGIVFIGMCAGNVIGPLLYSTDEAPLYRTGLIADLAMFVTVGVISGLTPFYLAYLNRKHEKARAQLGKSEHLVDSSMVGKEKLQESKALEVEDARDQRTSVENDKGLMDVTDLKNEDFIFVY